MPLRGEYSLRTDFAGTGGRKLGLTRKETKDTQCRLGALV